MAGRRIDYDGMISVYDYIKKTRSLTQQEADRLSEILRLKHAAEKTRRYRENNKDLLAEKERTRRSKDGDKIRARARNYTKQNSTILARKAKEWRERNPERAAADKQRWYEYLNRGKATDV